ncbi:hypothetical protein [Streptomyces sp. NPDC006334]|uniref:hypothetical protein n=1 Tax=Streptomyces sp. NPDC006334 TaxID=3156754 RepID=UPI0033B927AC
MESSTSLTSTPRMRAHIGPNWAASVPVNRLSALARYGQLSKAQTIERAPEPRRTALLTAVVCQLEAQAVDDALDLFTGSAGAVLHRIVDDDRTAGGVAHR